MKHNEWKKLKILNGSRYGNLTIINEVDAVQYKEKLARMFLCQCDCGNTKIIALNNLRRGKIISCGCYHKKEVTLRSTKHSLYYHPLYSIWIGMKQRCYNPNNKFYHRYGGRGIKICDEWLNDVRQFITDMYPTWQEDLSIDRKDNDMGYSKDNCRWATRKEQSNNQSPRVPLSKLDVTIRIIVER